MRTHITFGQKHKPFGYVYRTAANGLNETKNSFIMEWRYKAFLTIKFRKKVKK